MALLAALACQRRERADDEHTIRVGVADEPSARTIDYYIYDALARPNAAGKLEPRLAKSWDASADELTVHLRDDVRWHDGEKFTADDVVSTFAALHDPRVASVRSGGQYTVIIKTSDINVLDVYIHPKDARGNIGTGIYKFVRQDEGRILLHRNEDYFGHSHAHMVELAFIHVPDEPTALLMAKNGDLDVIERLGTKADDDAVIADKFTTFTRPDTTVSLVAKRFVHVSTTPAGAFRYEDFAAR